MLYNKIIESTIKYNHELWIVTERTRLASAGLSFRERVRNSGIELLLLRIIMMTDAVYISVLILLDLIDLNHNILLNTLKVLAVISGSAIGWCCTYFSERTFSVKFSPNTVSLTCKGQL